jgi:hypothetical protein
MGLIITALSLALSIRDFVLDPQERNKALRDYIPPLPWYWWVIGGVLCLMVLALEGAYRVHRNEYAKLVAKYTKFTSRHREKLRELKKEYQLNEIQTNLRKLRGANNYNATSPPLPMTASTTTGVPVLELMQPRTIHRWIDSTTEKFEIEEEMSNQAPRRGMEAVNIALARFRYKPATGIDPFIHVRAHIHFSCTKNSDTEDNDGVWWQEQDREKEFHVGDTHDLIIACALPVKNETETPMFFQYGYKTKPYTSGGGRFLAPLMDVLPEAEYHVTIDLVLLYMNEIVDTPTFSYLLKFDGKYIPILTQLEA